ncbi:MAG: hypothetical protein ACYC6L_03165 [Anaerolineae bacterium]
MKQLLGIGVALFLLVAIGCAPTAVAPQEVPADTPGAEQAAASETPGDEEVSSGETPAVETGQTIKQAQGPAVRFCADPQPPFITDFEVRQEQPIAEPARGAAFRDAIYGGCVVRVTDRTQDLAPGDPPSGLLNEYSRLESFNADESLILVRSTEASYYVYDAATFEVLGRLPDMVDPRWSNKDPDLLYYIGELKLMSYNIGSGEIKVVHDFTADFPGQKLTYVWTRYEGSQSLDDRYWALMAEDQDYMTVALLVYDVQSDQVTARRTVDPPADVDSVTISPLGNYVLAQFDYCEQGSMGTGEQPCGLMVYDRDLQNARGLLRIVGHSDIALDAAGSEVFVYQDIDTDSIALLDLASGAVSSLFPIDFTYCDGCGMHFSGQGYRLPGWALLSYYDGDPTTHMWMDDHIFAFELKPGGRVVHFAQHHSLVDPEQEHDYWAEPHASVNRDFTRILFSSNWGRSGTGQVDMYMVVLPDNWSALPE